MRRVSILALLAVVSLPFASGAATGARARNAAPAEQDNVRPLRALLVAAHPDDEYELAGTIYRITEELSGTVDQVIITDGEAGYRYSFLASRYYGIDLTDEKTGRANLPRIREEEARRAARILGIRHQWFLNERDDQFTTNLEAALQSWHVDRVLNDLSERLRTGRYDVLFLLLPTQQTHGGHKAASLLALEAVEKLPESERPAVVGVEADPTDAISYKALPGYPLTTTTSSQPQFHFDRDVHFGFRNSLSYEIVVNWVIAEHKSQGLFQTKCGQDRFENFWIFAVSGAGSLSRTAPVFEKISGQSHVAGK